MGREANFSELREAIRQGQAKIAQGLKTGQMRSDRQAGSSAPRRRLDEAHEVLGKKPTLTEQSALFEREKRPKFRLKLPALPKLPKLPKIRMPNISMASARPVLLGAGAVLGVAAAVLLLFLVGKFLVGLVPSRTPVAEDTTARQPVDTPAPAQPQPAVQRPPVVPPVSTDPVRPAPVPTPTRTGDNVIVIQGITASRENELLAVRDYFARHGIATEILRGGSNYSRLVTRDRFENPNRSGTDGYEMRMRIRALGKRYPAETGDTKFGAEPFQDAYGLLRQ